MLGCFLVSSRAPGTLASGYDRIAPEFLATRSRIGAEPVRAWARSLRRGSVVLELGCGSGVPITEQLLAEGLSVFALDASPTLVAAFRTQFPGVTVACEPVETSTLFERPFDAVLAWGLWFLLPSSTQVELLRRVAFVLRPKGRLLFTAPEQRATWVDTLTGERSCSLGADAYRRAMAQSGLAVIHEYEDRGQNHYYEAQKTDGTIAQQGKPSTFRRE